jgi:hypothetical protein
MSRSTPANRRLRYKIDPGHRDRRRRQSRRTAHSQKIRLHCDSWGVAEMLGILGVSYCTLRRYERAGVIPKVTYPSPHRRYWRHQALLLVWLFSTMRMEGWPRRRPHFVGSVFWTLALQRLHTEWNKELPHEG